MIDEHMSEKVLRSYARGNPILQGTVRENLIIICGWLEDVSM